MTEAACFVCAGAAHGRLDGEPICGACQDVVDEFDPQALRQRAMDDWNRGQHVDAEAARDLMGAASRAFNSAAWLDAVRGTPMRQEPGS